MTPNLPPHLQEKMERNFEKQWQHQQGAVFLKKDEIYTHRRNLTEFFYREAYLQAYSDLIAELGPVVEALTELAQPLKNVSITVGLYDSYVCEEAEQVLKHLKERILPEERTGG